MAAEASTGKAGGKAGGGRGGALRGQPGISNTFERVLAPCAASRIVPA
ncbi:MAG: hypothetical protein RL514_2977 [Verrucomicrobiota bacterium]|jgi:hypothetical protein